MPRPRIRILSSGDVLEALPMVEAVEVMKSAFVQLSSGKAEVPLRTHIESKIGPGGALFMPCYLPEEQSLGLKVVTVFGDNPARGLPRIQALVVVFDGSDGRPRAVLDGAALTALRTGAASGAATDLLARTSVETAAIFGAGVQGRTQLEAVCAVRSIRRARVHDVSLEAATRYVGELSGKLGIDLQVAASAVEAVRDADVICTATNSSHPVFDDRDLAPGVHINAVGSYQPWVQEVPPETVVRARVVVDHVASALAETGDLIVPIKEGRISESHVHAELGAIVAGREVGRQDAAEITLFKSVGVAVQDLAAAARILERAEERDLGTVIAM